jgi:hypothetical protein
MSPWRGGVNDVLSNSTLAVFVSAGGCRPLLSFASLRRPVHFPTLQYLTLPYLYLTFTLPLPYLYLTLPYLTLPYTLPYLTLPYLALPCLTFFSFFDVVEALFVVLV